MGTKPTSARRLARTWWFRAASEHASAERFRRLSRELRETEAEPVVIRMAEEAVDEELRHEQLCAALARRFDPDAPPEHSHASGPVGAPSLSLRDRVLQEIVAFCCVAETMNVAVLSESLHVATDPEVHDVIHQIVRDEVSHSRLGWAHLSAERAKGRGEFLNAVLPRMLGQAHAETVFGHEEQEEDADVAHGEIARAAMRKTVAHTLRSVIFPGLRTHGLSVAGAEQWLLALEGSQAGM